MQTIHYFGFPYFGFPYFVFLYFVFLYFVFLYFVFPYFVGPLLPLIFAVLPLWRSLIYIWSMDKLYHYLLCPQSRGCRILLAELNIEVALHDIRPVWHYSPNDVSQATKDFLRLNPAGALPVLVHEAATEKSGAVIAGAYALTEWLLEQDKAHLFVPQDPATRAEMRRLIDWFHHKFAREAGSVITDEKINRRLMGAASAANMDRVRVGLANLAHHLGYMQYLLEQRDWLAGAHYSAADCVAAAHLSCLDYSGDIVWKSYPLVREWYARIKSRPAFRPLLADYISGFRPLAHYADLDFY